MFLKCSRTDKENYPFFFLNARLPDECLWYIYWESVLLTFDGV